VSRALPYVCAGLIGLQWDNLPGWIIAPVLALCVWLVYLDSRNED
jgi:hypothetical protein